MLVADFAIRDIAMKLEAKPGITVLMGPSGAGKSTVLHGIAGLIEPDRGSVKLGDEVWFDGATRVPVERRRIAYVFQNLALFPHMTALGNVMYGNPDEARARTLLDRVGVAQLADRRPRTFSGGEAQRVAWARALAIEPRLILLDEPYSALDKVLRDQLVAFEVEIAAELAVPVIHVTHSEDEAAALGGTIITLSRAIGQTSRA
ncbi:MAG: ATP-binding cassette domain-containing protein [Kofleriaceae bacterium]